MKTIYDKETVQSRMKYVLQVVEVLVFGNDVRIYGQSKLLAEYGARIDYHEKMLRRTYTRLVRKGGAIKFQNVRNHIGQKLTGQSSDNQGPVKGIS